MNNPNQTILQNATLTTLPDLDTVVLAALELFEQKQLPAINVINFKRPLVVGSGNAEATGRIMFRDSDAIFASESDVEEKLKHLNAIDEVVLLSASGGKHAPIIAKLASQYGKHVTLLTNTADSAAKKALELSDLTEHVFPKNREPYTYNTSTYMGMMLAQTGEDPSAIKDFILQTVASIDFSAFSDYTKYYLIVPPEFSGIIRMLHVKFIELFGRNVARDIETSEYVRHATTIAASNELFISFGEPNTKWGSPKRRMHIPLPNGAGYVAMMAVGYYVIAQIQKRQPQYFKENITAWAEEISKMYGEALSPIVEGN